MPRRKKAGSAGDRNTPVSIVEGMGTPPERDSSKNAVKIAEEAVHVPFHAVNSPSIRHMNSDIDFEASIWNYVCALPSSKTDDETDWMLRENRVQIFVEEICARKSDIDFTDKDSTPEVRERSGKDLANQLKERIKGLQDRKFLNAELLGPGLLDFVAFAKERIANWEGKYGRLVDHSVYLTDVILAPHQVIWLEQLNNEGKRHCEEVISKQRDEKAQIKTFSEYPIKPVDIKQLDTNVQVIFYLVKLHHFIQAIMGEHKTIAQFLVERFDEVWRAYPFKTLKELLRDTLQMLPESIYEVLPNSNDRREMIVTILSKTDFWSVHIEELLCMTTTNFPEWPEIFGTIRHARACKPPLGLKCALDYSKKSHEKQSNKKSVAGKRSDNNSGSKQSDEKDVNGDIKLPDTEFKMLAGRFQKKQCLSCGSSEHSNLQCPDKKTEQSTAHIKRFFNLQRYHAKEWNKRMAKFVPREYQNGARKEGSGAPKGHVKDKSKSKSLVNFLRNQASGSRRANQMNILLHAKGNTRVYASSLLHDGAFPVSRLIAEDEVINETNTAHGLTGKDLVGKLDLDIPKYYYECEHEAVYHAVSLGKMDKHIPRI